MLVLVMAHQSKSRIVSEHYLSPFSLVFYWIIRIETGGRGGLAAVAASSKLLICIASDYALDWYDVHICIYSYVCMYVFFRVFVCTNVRQYWTCEWAKSMCLCICVQKQKASTQHTKKRVVISCFQCWLPGWLCLYRNDDMNIYINGLIGYSSWRSPHLSSPKKTCICILLTHSLISFINYNMMQ